MKDEQFQRIYSLLFRLTDLIPKLNQYRRKIVFSNSILSFQDVLFSFNHFRRKKYINNIIYDVIPFFEDERHTFHPHYILPYYSSCHTCVHLPTIVCGKNFQFPKSKDFFFSIISDQNKFLYFVKFKKISINQGIDLFKKTIDARKYQKWISIIFKEKILNPYFLNEPSFSTYELTPFTKDILIQLLRKHCNDKNFTILYDYFENQLNLEVNFHMRKIFSLY